MGPLQIAFWIGGVFGLIAGLRASPKHLRNKRNVLQDSTALTRSPGNVLEKVMPETIKENQPANDMALKEPMLAGTYNSKRVTFPIFAQPKIDGIRIMIDKGVAYTRSLAPFPNHHLQDVVKRNARAWQGYDGELTIGNTLKESQSIMSKYDQHAFIINVFDVWDSIAAFSERMTFDLKPSRYVRRVNTVLLSNIADLESYERECISNGYEGIILRDPSAQYKHGRSHACELVKIKRFTDSEGLLIGFNRNGSMLVRHEVFGQITISNGLPDSMRANDSLMGRMVKFKYQTHGTDHTPRHATFIAMRDNRDM